MNSQAQKIWGRVVQKIAVQADNLRRACPLDRAGAFTPKIAPRVLPRFDPRCIIRALINLIWLCKRGSLDVRFAPKATELLRRREMSRWATGQLCPPPHKSILRKIQIQSRTRAAASATGNDLSICTALEERLLVSK
jgi:hypothetical protein